MDDSQKVYMGLIKSLLENRGIHIDHLGVCLGVSKYELYCAKKDYDKAVEGNQSHNRLFAHTITHLYLKTDVDIASSDTSVFMNPFVYSQSDIQTLAEIERLPSTTEEEKSFKAKRLSQANISEDPDGYIRLIQQLLSKYGTEETKDIHDLPEYFIKNPLDIQKIGLLLDELDLSKLDEEEAAAINYYFARYANDIAVLQGTWRDIVENSTLEPRQALALSQGSTLSQEDSPYSTRERKQPTVPQLDNIIKHATLIKWLEKCQSIVDENPDEEIHTCIHVPGHAMRLIHNQHGFYFKDPNDSHQYHFTDVTALANRIERSAFKYQCDHIRNGYSMYEAFMQVDCVQASSGVAVTGHDDAKSWSKADWQTAHDKLAHRVHDTDSRVNARQQNKSLLSKIGRKIKGVLPALRSRNASEADIEHTSDALWKNLIQANKMIDIEAEPPNTIVLFNEDQEISFQHIHDADLMKYHQHHLKMTEKCYKTYVNQFRTDRYYKIFHSNYALFHAPHKCNLKLVEGRPVIELDGKPFTEVDFTYTQCIQLCQNIQDFNPELYNVGENKEKWQLIYSLIVGFMKAGNEEALVALLVHNDLTLEQISNMRPEIGQSVKSYFKKLPIDKQSNSTVRYISEAHEYDASLCPALFDDKGRLKQQHEHVKMSPQFVKYKESHQVDQPIPGFESPLEKSKVKRDK